ncbi:hypothetical protein ColLi_11560 [Colletotrichum liriopes]|uniref:Uncharacterized protein n=1 Tax=Colletotrichum liriopes TaxID=708192 RepID=A0AA37LXV8_9PEZI|nr:hypothetical protein ColLi_11560 [Colletotrichum liriopes]
MSSTTQDRVHKPSHLRALSEPVAPENLGAPARDEVPFGRQEIETPTKVDQRHATARLKWQAMVEDYFLARGAPYSPKLDGTRREGAESNQLVYGRKPGGPIVKCPAETSAIFAVMGWVDIARIIDLEGREQVPWDQLAGISAFIEPPTKGHEAQTTLTDYVGQVAASCGNEDWLEAFGLVKAYVAQRHPTPANVFTETGAYRGFDHAEKRLRQIVEGVVSASTDWQPRWRAGGFSD